MVTLFGILLRQIDPEFGFPDRFDDELDGIDRRAVVDERIEAVVLFTFRFKCCDVFQTVVLHKSDANTANAWKRSRNDKVRQAVSPTVRNFKMKVRSSSQ
jgi:hypothetical protein